MMKFATILFLFIGLKGFSQTTPQYVISDVEYSYTLNFSGISDEDDAKIPKALVFDLFKIMPDFDFESASMSFTSKKNKSKSEITSYFLEHGIEVTEIEKSATDRSNANPE